MTDTVIKVLIKALAGGFLVLAFTAVAEVLTPKRLAVAVGPRAGGPR